MKVSASVRQINALPYEDVRSSIRDGDVLMYRGRNLPSRLETGMRDPLNSVLVASWLLLLLATAISAQQPGPRPAPSLSDEEASGLPYTYSIAGFEDQGTFTLLINEEQVGTTEFAWRKDGSYDSHFLLKLGGQSPVSQTFSDSVLGGHR